MRLLVDGKNLSLKDGTGVATYARSVCQVARQAGHSVDVLYGERFGASKSDLFREIAFFDTEARYSRQANTRREIRANVSHLWDAKPFRVPLDGRVISRSFKDRLPDVDGLWNATDAYFDAETAFRRSLRVSRTFNRLANPQGWELAHWTFPIPLKLRGALNIYTIHDLVPLRLPYTTLDHKRAFYRAVDRICREADVVLTVSEESKRDIHSFFDIADEKVVNTYQSVDLPSAQMALPDDVLAAELKSLHGLDHKGYILFYGAIEPKKNVGRLLEAYMASGIDIPLVVAGKDGWLIGRDLDLIGADSNQMTVSVNGRKEKRPRIRRMSYVPFHQLIGLIRGARMVALPSIYEGFGLPIIEGMLCGTPVLTSDLGATREVAGDAALLVDPYDVRAIKDGLVALCGDAGLQSEMAARGSRRAQDFSPQRFAASLDAAYRHATGLAARP